MNSAHHIRGREALALLAVISWLGVLLQLYLSTKLAFGNGKSLVDGLVAFLGYFTVLTNIFVALASLLPITFGNSRLGRWFGTGMVLGSATTAILLVGVAYHFLLRNVWSPEGLQWFADVVLHYAVPAACFAYWISFPPAQQLSIWAPLAWCIYPATYLVYAFARGALLDSYPYHFINVSTLGYPKVLMNSFELLVAFVVIGYVVYGIARLRTRASTSSAGLRR